MEFAILDWIQTLRAPWLDSVMVFISSLGNAGAIWIVLAIVLLFFRKTRRAGAAMLVAMLIRMQPWPVPYWGLNMVWQEFLNIMSII